MQIDAEVMKVMNEASKEELKVGDKVYLRGDYGLYDDVYEIVKITDSKDPELENADYGDTLYRPNADDVIDVAILKDKEGKIRSSRIQPSSSWQQDPIVLVSEVEAMGIDSLDLTGMADSLKVALKDAGIDTDLEIKLGENKGKVFPKISIQGKTNVVDQCGIWKYAVDEITIGSWGSGYVDMEGKIIVFNLHFDYHHTNGGSNGCDFGKALYLLKDNTWSLYLGKQN